MKRDDISEAMNYLDDELIAHAYNIRNGGRKNMAKKRVIMIAVAAAVLAVCSITAYAGASNGGWMQDIKNVFGAITGQKYNEADTEIELSVVNANQAGVTVMAEFKMPDKPPYTVLDTIKIGDYHILDSKGNIVASGSSTEPTEISEEQALLYISADLPKLEKLYLIVDGFVGEAKAEQPLEIEGTWKCSFTID